MKKKTQNAGTAGKKQGGGGCTQGKPGLRGGGGGGGRWGVEVCLQYPMPPKSGIKQQTIEKKKNTTSSGTVAVSSRFFLVSCQCRAGMTHERMRPAAAMSTMPSTMDKATGNAK